MRAAALADAGLKPVQARMRGNGLAHGRRIAVIGLGSVGLPVAVALARVGAPVVGFDSDRARVAELGGGRTKLARGELWRL